VNRIGITLACIIASFAYLYFLTKLPDLLSNSDEPAKK
jgi:hypothetical protein